MYKGPAVSATGEALHRLPPMVAVLRICHDPIRLQARARVGTVRRAVPVRVRILRIGEEQPLFEVGDPIAVGVIPNVGHVKLQPPRDLAIIKGL